MWEDLQEKARSLAKATGLTYPEIAEEVSARMGTPVSRHEVSHTFNDERVNTPKGRKILMHATDYLAETRNAQTRRLREVARKADRALSDAA